MPRKSEYWTDPKKFIRKTIEWQKNNPEKYKAKQRRYAERHKEKLKEYRREYQQRPEVKEMRRLKQIERRKLNPKCNSAYHIVERHCDLAKECELCPEDDKRIEKLQAHHFAGYGYPDIFITICNQCHRWVDTVDKNRQVKEN